MIQNVHFPVSAKTKYAGPVLLVSTCWWPSFARFAHLLVLTGCRVSVLCPPGHPARVVPGVTVFDQQPFNPTAALSKAIAECQPVMVVPSDDRAVANLHELYQTGSATVRDLIVRSLGAPESYSIVRSRVRLIALARELGIAVPDDHAIGTAKELDDWLARAPGPWVVKVDGAWAGTGVRIATTPKQAHAAFRYLPRRLHAGVALKRLLVNRDPYWLADWRDQQPPEVSAQGHIKGWPGNLAMVCREGEVLAATVAEAVACWGETGPSTIVRLVHRPDFVADARRLARRLKLTGFYGLDFMVEQSTGKMILIEMNPRVTALANIRLHIGGDLIGAAASLFSGVPCPRPASLPADELVAHFPLAWHWNRNDPRLEGCFQDIPWGEPALVTEMLRPSWPDRPFLARMASGTLRLIKRNTNRVRLAGAALRHPDREASDGLAAPPDSRTTLSPNDTAAKQVPDAIKTLRDPATTRKTLPSL
jgi:hypothetical protein